MDRVVPPGRNGIGGGRNGSFGFFDSLISQQYHGQASDDEPDYLSETSTVVHGGSSVEGGFRFQQEMVSGSSGRAFDLNSSALSHEVDNWNRSASLDVSNNNAESLKHLLDTPESSTLGISRDEPTAVTVTVPGTNSGKRALTRSTVSDRARKAMINERLESLQSLLPHAGKDSKEAELEDVIDYVKYLRLQAKTLSRCKLGGEATQDPFIHLEGFGHYLVDQHMLTEPLEELLGQMMETDMSAAAKLLEAKGLYVMPMALAQGL